MKAGILALALGSCIGSLAAGPAWAGPLSLETFFKGRLSAAGTVDNLRTGTRRTFTMAMQASWDGPVGTLVEDVVFGDGERQRKVWRFERKENGRYVGRRDDVTEDAVVTEDAEGVRMQYKANTPVGSGLSLNLSFDDRLTLTGPGIVTVRSEITYLMVSAARMDMTIKKAASK